MYSSDFNIQITALYMLTPMFALLYFNPKITIYSCVIATISMMAGVIVTSPKAGPELWHVSPIHYILTTGGGRLIEMIFASGIVISASSITRSLMISLQQNNDKISSMQSGLVYSFADMIESRDGTFTPWMVWWLERIEASGYNSFSNDGCANDLTLFTPN